MGTEISAPLATIMIHADLILAMTEQQVRLLRELYVLYQASGGRGGYYGYHYGDDRSIEFSSIGSRQLWPLLDEAAAAGLQLVYPGNRGELADVVPVRGDRAAHDPRRERHVVPGRVAAEHAEAGRIYGCTNCGLAPLPHDVA